MQPQLVLRTSRRLAGLSQGQAARLAGTAQSALSAYENGTKVPTPEVVARILAAEGFHPAMLVDAHREEIRAIAARNHGERIRLFGSAARGEDSASSDLDFLVRFAPGASLLDLVDMADELESLLGVPADVISEAGLSDRHARVLHEAVDV